MSAHKNRLRRGQALRDDAARAAGNRNLSLPPGWHLDKHGFPFKGGGKGDAVMPPRTTPRGP
jgi:hypothetical protein